MGPCPPWRPSLRPFRLGFPLRACPSSIDRPILAVVYCRPASCSCSRFGQHNVAYGVKSQFSDCCRIWLAAKAICTHRPTSMPSDFRIISQVFVSFSSLTLFTQETAWRQALTCLTSYIDLSFVQAPCFACLFDPSPRTTQESKGLVAFSPTPLCPCCMVNSRAVIRTTGGLGIMVEQTQCSICRQDFGLR